MKKQLENVGSEAHEFRSDKLGKSESESEFLMRRLRRQSSDRHGPDSTARSEHLEMRKRVPEDSLDISGSESADSSPATLTHRGSSTPHQQDDGSQEVGAGRSKSGCHRYSADPEFLGMEVDSSSI